MRGAGAISNRIGNILGLLCLGLAIPAKAQDAGQLIDAAYQAGASLFEAYAPEEVKAEYEWPSPEDWQTTWRRIEQALQGDSLEALSELAPRVEGLMRYLEEVDGFQPYADWLRQRADYFGMAEHVVRTYPAPPTSPSPAPAPSRAPLEEKRAAASQNSQVWKQKLRSRPEPQNAAQLIPGLKTIFIEEGVPPELVWLAEVESSLNPRARSPVGAAGLFQFMPPTAERFGLQVKPTDERLDPEKSARAAAQYLRLLYRRFDAWPLALAAYNAGEGRVSRTLKQHGGATFEDIAAHLPSETRMYVPKIEAAVSVREGVDLSVLPAPRAS